MAEEECPLLIDTDILEDRVQSVYDRVRETPVNFAARQRLREHIQTAVELERPRLMSGPRSAPGFIPMEIFGSTLNQTGCNDNNLDIVMIVNRETAGQWVLDPQPGDSDDDDDESEGEYTWTPQTAGSSRKRRRDERRTPSYLPKKSQVVDRVGEILKRRVQNRLFGRIHVLKATEKSDVVPCIRLSQPLRPDVVDVRLYVRWSLESNVWTTQRTAFLEVLCRIEPQYVLLTVFFKRWTRSRGISAGTRGMASYALCTLLFHHLHNWEGVFAKPEQLAAAFNETLYRCDYSANDVVDHFRDSELSHLWPPHREFGPGRRLGLIIVEFWKRHAVSFGGRGLDLSVDGAMRVFAEPGHATRIPLSMQTSVIGRFWGVWPL